MKVKFEKVFSEEIKELRFESWIIVELESGKKIEVYHQSDYDFREYIGKILDCLIDIYIFDNLNNPNPKSDNPIIKGKYSKRYTVPQHWFKGETSNFLKSFTKMRKGVKTKDGIFLINPNKLERFNIKDGEVIEFNVVRFYLVRWHPLS